MDPLTQGVLGAVAVQQIAKPRVLLAASVMGALSGMAADVDVVIRSATDPLFALEFHRHFTHSLFFIPVGGLICALFFFYVFQPCIRRLTLSFRQVYCFCTLGYATHGLLDACTTYGTQLLWPFSDVRVAWNTISIIDPLYTLPLLLLIVLAVVQRRKPVLSKRLSLMAFGWVIMYTSLGVIQRERAENMGLQIAESRGHKPLLLEAKPSFANILVWKIVYSVENGGGERLYVDAVRAGWTLTDYQGGFVEKLDLQRDFPWLSTDSQQFRDVERFRWFSNDYLAVSPDHPNRIIDMRYSLLPNQIKGLWGVELDQSSDSSAHVRYVSDRQRSEDAFKLLWGMIKGEEQ